VIHVVQLRAGGAQLLGVTWPRPSFVKRYYFCQRKLTKDDTLMLKIQADVRLGFFLGGLRVSMVFSSVSKHAAMGCACFLQSRVRKLEGKILLPGI
jgi:hypothetical protein